MIIHKFSILGSTALFLLMLVCTSCGNQKPLEIKTKTVGDIELAYYMRGSGDPLVMIMGFRGTMAAWDPALLEVLEKHFTLILFDNRGMGMSSDTPNDNTTIQQMADDTVGLIAALGYKKANILGWSMGSRIAMQMAISHPEVVDHTVLCSPNPGKNEVPRETNAYNLLTSPKINKEKILSTIFPNTIEGKTAAAAYAERLGKATIERTVPDDWNVPQQTVDRQVKALKLWYESDAVYNALAKVKNPMLVAAGLSDVLDPVGNAQIVANRIPYAWSAYFADAGHAFLFQDAQRFGELVILFINSTKSPAE